MNNRKKKIIFFIVKTIIFIIAGLIIWKTSTAKQHGTEKDIGENLVADEIEEVAEIVIA